MYPKWFTNRSWSLSEMVHNPKLVTTRNASISKMFHYSRLFSTRNGSLPEMLRFPKLVTTRTSAAPASRISAALSTRTSTEGPSWSYLRCVLGAIGALWSTFGREVSRFPEIRLEIDFGITPRRAWRGLGYSRLRARVQRFRGGLLFKAHSLCVSLNSKLESNKEE